MPFCTLVDWAATMPRRQESTRHGCTPQEAGPGATDLIGVVEAPAGGVMSMFSRGTAGARHDAFALGERANILLHLDQNALIPHVMESEGRKFPYEVTLQNCKPS